MNKPQRKKSGSNHKCPKASEARRQANLLKRRTRAKAVQKLQRVRAGRAWVVGPTRSKLPGGPRR